jgi:hypothetical protein
MRDFTPADVGLGSRTANFDYPVFTPNSRLAVRIGPKARSALYASRFRPLNRG